MIRPLSCRRYTSRLFGTTAEPGRDGSPMAGRPARIMLKPNEMAFRYVFAVINPVAGRGRGHRAWSGIRSVLRATGVDLAEVLVERPGRGGGGGGRAAGGGGGPGGAGGGGGACRGAGLRPRGVGGRRWHDP